MDEDELRALAEEIVGIFDPCDNSTPYRRRLKHHKLVDTLLYRYLVTDPWAYEKLGYRWGLGPQRARQINTPLRRNLRNEGVDPATLFAPGLSP